MVKFGSEGYFLSPEGLLAADWVQEVWFQMIVGPVS